MKTTMEILKDTHIWEVEDKLILAPKYVKVPEANMTRSTRDVIAVCANANLAKHITYLHNDCGRLEFMKWTRTTDKKPPQFKSVFVRWARNDYRWAHWNSGAPRGTQWWDELEGDWRYEPVCWIDIPDDRDL